MSTNPTTDTKALAVVEELTAPTIYAGINRGQLELLKRTYAKGTTDDEFALFMNTAQRLKLDPFARQIYAVKRWDSTTKTEVMATQVAIDGYRAVAEDTGECDGREGPFWCDDDGVWREVWTSAKPPAAAKVVVYRKGVGRPYVGVATYKSYVQKNKDGGPRATWATMPDVMLAKCAEAQALRAAFPKQLSGTQVEDEGGAIDQPEVEVIKLPTATAAVVPAATQPKTPADTWPALLADLAPLVDDAMGAHVGKPIEAWTEADVEAAMSYLLDGCKTPTEADAKIGPWGRALNKHARPGSKAAALYASFRDAFKTRRDKLKAEAAEGETR